MENCKNIKDFNPISKVEKLEDLDVSFTNISDISFLEKNKNVKQLNLYSCKNINNNNNIFKKKYIFVIQ